MAVFKVPVDNMYTNQWMLIEKINMDRDPTYHIISYVGYPRVSTPVKNITEVDGIHYIQTRSGSVYSTDVEPYTDEMMFNAETASFIESLKKMGLKYHSITLDEWRQRTNAEAALPDK